MAQIATLLENAYVVESHQPPNDARRQFFSQDRIGSVGCLHKRGIGVESRANLRLQLLSRLAEASASACANRFCHQ